MIPEYCLECMNRQQMGGYMQPMPGYFAMPQTTQMPMDATMQQMQQGMGGQPYQQFPSMQPGMAEQPMQQFPSMQPGMAEQPMQQFPTMQPGMTTQPTQYFPTMQPGMAAQPMQPMAPVGGLTGIEAQPSTPVETDIGYTQGYLKTKIGSRVKIDFLIGTNQFQDREGTLLAVGISYVIIREIDTDDELLCDIYSIKFVRFYY